MAKANTKSKSTSKPGPLKNKSKSAPKQLVPDGPFTDTVIPGEWHVRYNYSVGKVAGHFFEGLKKKKILASKCSKSGIAYLPPRAYCERSFEPCDGWVEVGQEGMIESATVVTAAFPGLPAPPYAIAFVRLNGCSTAMANFVLGLDLSDVPKAAAKMKPGTKVKAVFKTKPEGKVTDFHYELKK